MPPPPQFDFFPNFITFFGLHTSHPHFINKLWNKISGNEKVFFLQYSPITIYQNIIPPGAGGYSVKYTPLTLLFNYSVYISILSQIYFRLFINFMNA